MLSMILLRGTQEIDNLLTGKHEVVHTCGWYLRTFITDAKAKGATAIVCSPIPRNARCVVAGLRAFNSCPLTNYLRENPARRELAR